MFNKHYEIDYSDKDVMGFLKPHVLLNYLSNIATINASVNKFGYKEVSEKNCGWFVLKYALEFDNYPENLEELVIETTPRGANKLFVFRDFVLKNKFRASLEIEFWNKENLHTEIKHSVHTHSKSKTVEHRHKR